MQKSKLEVIKVVSLEPMAEMLPNVPDSLKISPEFSISFRSSFRNVKLLFLEKTKLQSCLQILLKTNSTKTCIIRQEAEAELANQQAAADKEAAFKETSTSQQELKVFPGKQQTEQTLFPG